jgi:hypothetical protein
MAAGTAAIVAVEVEEPSKAKSFRTPQSCWRAAAHPLGPKVTIAGDIIIWF